MPDPLRNLYGTTDPDSLVVGDDPLAYGGPMEYNDPALPSVSGIYYEPVDGGDSWYDPITDFFFEDVPGTASDIVGAVGDVATSASGAVSGVTSAVSTAATGIAEVIPGIYETLGQYLPWLLLAAAVLVAVFMFKGGLKGMIL